MIVMPGHPEWQGWGDLEGQPPPLSPEMFGATPGQPVSAEQRTIILDWTVNQYIARGWRVESRSPTQAVMARGKPRNDVLHAILTIITCLLWLIVWAVMAASDKQERVAITVDQLGHVISVQAPPA
ncbi:hypothetical protein [Streptomyces sviceus]|uniref:hypothetical protein n=1 Tax=Streptomyces sviceus TaxID=285530 RepID=UPI00369A84A5